VKKGGRWQTWYSLSQGLLKLDVSHFGAQCASDGPGLMKCTGRDKGRYEWTDMDERVLSETLRACVDIKERPEGPAMSDLM
jgi:hypothetical protein